MSGRIEIHVSDIDWRPCNNRLLVKVDVVDGRRNGIYVGAADWDIAGHVTRTGVVVKTPSKLFFRSKGDEWGVEWLTDLEACVGDEAFWGIMEGSNCPIVYCGSDIYYLVDYASIRMLKRGEEIIPVNGFVLVEKKEEVDRTSVLIVDHAKKVNKSRGVVIKSGKPNVEYYGAEQYDAQNLKEGDEVMFSISAWTELEDERYARFNKGVGYIQGRWIIASL